MPRPKIHHTEDQRRNANRLKSKESYQRHKAAINARRREQYHEKKRSQLREIAKKEQTRLNTLMSRRPAQEEPKKTPLELEVEHQLSLVRLFKARFEALTGGSPSNFLRTVITNFEENRHRHQEAAQYTIEAHMNKFEALVDQFHKPEERILNLAGAGTAWREIQRVRAPIKSLISSLVEVYEVAYLEPKAVLSLYKQGRYSFQKE